MIFLSLRTDKLEAELALFDDLNKIAEIKWQAHRILADTIHLKIKEILASTKFKLEDIQGIVCLKGPGSFTGLRIGLTVANTIAQSLNIPIVAENGEAWQESAVKKILAGENDKIALPEYGANAKTTKPKK